MRSSSATMGEPLLPYSALLWMARIILLVSVVLHIVAAVELTRMNWAARPQGYETKQSIATTYAALTMRWSGVILALFIVYHLLHLTVGVGRLPARSSSTTSTVYHNVVAGFSVWYVSAVLHPGDGRPVPAPGPRGLEHAPDAGLEQRPEHAGPPDHVAGGGARGVRRLYLGAGRRAGRLDSLKECDDARWQGPPGTD